MIKQNEILLEQTKTNQKREYEDARAFVNSLVCLQGV